MKFSNIVETITEPYSDRKNIRGSNSQSTRNIINLSVQFFLKRTEDTDKSYNSIKYNYMYTMTQ